MDVSCAADIPHSSLHFPSSSSLHHSPSSCFCYPKRYCSRALLFFTTLSTAIAMPFRLSNIFRIFNMGKRAQTDIPTSPRIKDIRRRPRAPTPTGGAPASQPSGTFSSLSAAPSSQTPGFSAPSTQPTGFAFGQSQSFPGASSPPNQANQGGAAPFSFGGSGSTGFNFSSGLTSNPFAPSSFNAGTSAPAQPASSAGTTGFGGFGNQASAPPSFSSGLFGAQQNQTTSAPSAPIFGQAATSSAANSASDSMQTSPDAKPKAPSFNTDSSVQKNLFGGAGASNLFSSKPATAPASNPFGGLDASAATDKPSSDKAEGLAAKPAFSAQSNGLTTQGQPFASLFGASSATSAPSEPEKAKTPQPAIGNLFAPKPASSEAEKPGISQPAVNNLFSPRPAAGTASANLFAPKSTTEESSVSTTTSQPFKNLFGASDSTGPAFGGMSPSKPAGEQAPVSNLFAPKPPADGQSPDKAPDAQPFKSLFGTTPATSSVSSPGKAQPTAPAAAPSLFAQKPAAEGKPAETQPFKSLFGATPATSQSAEAAKPQSAPSLFAPKPATAQDTDKPAASQPFGSLFGSAATSKPSETAPGPAAPTNPFAAKPSVEQASTDAAKPAPSQPFGSLFGAKPPAPESKAAQAPAVTSTSTTSAKSLADQIPKPNLPAPAGKANEDTEMLWKVRSLDHFFKQEFLNYEPGTHSFDSLILFYLKARHAMGAPVKPKVAVKLSNGAHTNLATPPQPDDLAAKAPPATPAAPAAHPNASATSNLFSQSFSSSPAHSANQPSSKETPTVSASPPAPKANPFASLSTGNATTSSTVKAPNAAPPAAPKLGGNIFANAQSSGAAAAPAIPKFGNGVSGTDFLAQFQKKAEQSMAEEKAKRKAEDFDSDEDDEAEWERRDAEKQREKRAKLEAASKKKTIFVPGEGFKFVDADDAPTASDSATSASQLGEKSPLTAASPAPSSASIFESSSRPLSNSENIFGRLSATPQPSDTGKDSDEEKKEGRASSPKRRASEDGSGDEGDFEAAFRKSKRAKPSDTTEATKSSLDTPLPAPTAAAGRSLFDRVESPAPQKESATSNLFSASLNKATASPSDNTWKPNSPIKFSSNPTPFSALSAAPTPADTSTQASSAENATSGDATPDEEAAPGAIYDMSNANAGEEEEEVVFECRARAFKLATGWASQGTGVVRLLKHPTTGRSRIVLRADPGGNVILNTLLKKEFEYSRASNSVQFMVPQPNNQKPEHWAIRVKAESIEPLHAKIQEIKY